MLHERVQNATDKGLLVVADLSDSDEGVWWRDYVRVLSGSSPVGELSSWDRPVQQPASVAE